MQAHQQPTPDKDLSAGAQESAEFDPIAYINEPRWHDSHLGLERIEELLHALGDPQDSLRFIHVAGTNGKGSTCAYLANILQEAGFKTGLFTSPYIERFEERIRIDGADISQSDLTSATFDVRSAAEQMDDHPTEFELMCAVAMVHFARCACDIVVLEVGLGGRYDATNVIKAPEACVITPIGLDHTNILGNSIAEIAAEKAGIIKPGCPVVTCLQESDAMRVIRLAANEAGAQLNVVDFSQLRVNPITLGTANERRMSPSHLAHSAQQRAYEPSSRTAPDEPSAPLRRFDYHGERYSTRLLASYQPQNAALAIDAAKELIGRGWSIPQSAIELGVANAQWPGRFEVVRTDPLFVVDGSHNAQGACVLAGTIRELLPERRCVFLVGVLADKDHSSILDAIAPLGAAFVTITAPNPRALAAEELASEITEKLSDLDCASMQDSPTATVIAASSVAAGVSAASELAGDDGWVCAMGSLYSIGDIKAALRSL